MKKLERKWARVCFALLVAAVICVVTPWLLQMLLDVTSFMYPIVFGALAVLLAGAEFLLSRKYLRCPHCGKSTVPPRWTNKNRYRCTRCATIFPFDDQPDLPVTTEEEDDDEEDYEDDEYDDDDEHDEAEETALKEEE